MGIKTMTSKEPVVVVYEGEDAVAIVKRDTKSKKTILYALHEMDMDDIEKLLRKPENKEIN